MNLGFKYKSFSEDHTVQQSQPVPAPAYDPSKPVALVVSSAHGAEISDFLPTYEILARSGHYNVFAVAPERKTLPLIGSAGDGGILDFMPQYSFAEYDSIIGRAPDLIAVPFFPGYTAERDAEVLHWLRTHASPQTTVLGICIGTIVVADSGLLDGHFATTNTHTFELGAERTGCSLDS